MAKRDLTVAEIKAFLESLADKVTTEGAELYEDVRNKVDELATAASEEVNEKIDEIRPKLAALRDKVTSEGRDILDAIDSRIDLVVDEVKEEIEELKELGLVEWAKANPARAAGTAAVILAFIILVVVAIF